MNIVKGQDPKKRDPKERIKVSGSTLFGDTREYEFYHIPALLGVQIIHDYSSVILANLDNIKQSFSEVKKIEGSDLVSGLLNLAPVIKMLPGILSWDRLRFLASVLLAGGLVDGEQIDDDGVCDRFGEDPTELYTAIFWALSVNYPKYFAPLLEAPEIDTSEDSIPDSSEGATIPEVKAKRKPTTPSSTR